MVRLIVTLENGITTASSPMLTPEMAFTAMCLLSENGYNGHVVSDVVMEDVNNSIIDITATVDEIEEYIDDVLALHNE